MSSTTNLNDDKECSHDRLEFMSQLIYSDPHHTKYWRQCVFCGAKLYEREIYHGIKKEH